MSYPMSEYQSRINNRYEMTKEHYERLVKAHPDVLGMPGDDDVVQIDILDMDFLSQSRYEIRLNSFEGWSIYDKQTESFIKVDFNGIASFESKRYALRYIKKLEANHD